MINRSRIGATCCSSERSFNNRAGIILDMYVDCFSGGASYVLFADVYGIRVRVVVLHYSFCFCFVRCRARYSVDTPERESGVVQ